MKNRPAIALWTLSFPVITIGWILWNLRMVSRDGLSLLGHDYSHYFARITIGAQHFWKNGFSIPHFTPSLAGGMPFFADPQGVFLSLPQFLAFFIDPLLATRLSLFIFYAFGYFGMAKLLKQFGLRDSVVRFGAIAFVLNGFSFAHLFVGHLTHAPFLLAPWILLLFFYRSPKLSDPASILVLLGYILSLFTTFYMGGLHVLVVFAAMGMVVLPAALHFQKHHLAKRALILRLLLGSFLFLLCISGQLVASILFSPNFYTGSIDRSADGILTLALRYFWFDSQNTPAGIPFGLWMFGAWEFVGFVTKATFVGLVLFVGIHFRRDFRRVGLQTLALVILVLLLANGSPLNPYLPFFRSYHNPTKILGAFVPLLILVTAISANWVVSRLESRVFFKSNLLSLMRVGLFLLLLSEFSIYAGFFRTLPGAASYPYPEESLNQIWSQRLAPPVTQVVQESGADLEMVRTGKTSLASYEPLFGYRHEALKAQLSLGSVWANNDGFFNLTHPGCLLYGKALGCEPWSRIPSSEKDSMWRFASGHLNPEWVPLWHRALIGFSLLLTLALLIATLILSVFVYEKSRESVGQSGLARA